MKATPKPTPREVFHSMLRAMYARSIDTEHLAPHQVTAVSRLLAMLESRRGVILADEVGLGKSYIAAAVAREMKTRGFDVVLIVPASLVNQWRHTLSLFRLDVSVITHDSLARRDCFPAAHPGRLLVVDEAHRFRNPLTKRYEALALQSIGNRLLLVTATPICNSLHDLVSLIHLIAADDELALEGVDSLERAFDAVDKRSISIAMDEFVVRRGRDVLNDSLAFGRLDRKVVRYRLLDHAIARGIESLEFPLIAAPDDRGLVRNILWRRLESSDAALADTLRRQSKFYRRARESLRDGFAMTKRDYLQIFGDDDGEPIQELLFPECWLTRGDVSQATRAQVDSEITRIDALTDALKRRDRKLATLERLLREMEGPTLLFTSSVATALHLYRSLRGGTSAGVISSRRCAMRDDRFRGRDGVLEAFCRGEIDVLISTDLGAEGLNLQRARGVIHYDLPWNPVKLDQRNGRAWRIGQTRPSVNAVYFIPEERSSRTVLSAIASKNRLRRAVLVDSAEVIDRALRECSAPHLASFSSRHGLLLAEFANARHSRLLLFTTDGSRWLDHSMSIDESQREERASHDRAEATRTIAARALLPPLLRGSHANAIFMSRVAVDRVLVDLLCARYRAGVEILLRQLAAELIDEAKLEYLRDVLLRESWRGGTPSVRVLARVPISAAPETAAPRSDYRPSTRTRKTSRAKKGE